MACRFWLGELPPINYLPQEAIRKSFAFADLASTSPRMLAVEMRRVTRPMSMYAVLGGIFTPNDSGNFSIIIGINEELEKTIQWPTLNPKDKVYIGLPKWCLQGILDGIEKTHVKAYSGELILNYAAHSEFGSSHVIFKETARVLVNLLFNVKAWSFLDSLDNEILR